MKKATLRAEAPHFLSVLNSVPSPFEEEAVPGPFGPQYFVDQDPCVEVQVIRCWGGPPDPPSSRLHESVMEVVYAR